MRLGASSCCWSRLGTVNSTCQVVGVDGCQATMLPLETSRTSKTSSLLRRRRSVEAFFFSQLPHDGKHNCPNVKMILGLAGA